MMMDSIMGGDMVISFARIYDELIKSILKYVCILTKHIIKKSHIQMLFFFAVQSVYM